MCHVILMLLGVILYGVVECDAHIDRFVVVLLVVQILMWHEEGDDVMG